jgi:glycosyltransferase involved in cell wall biosynthesis
MKNILIISTVSRQFHLFERVNIEILRALGFRVHAAASFDDRSPALDELDIVEHEISLTRFPISFANIKGLFKLVKIIKENNIEVVHCHSPSGGLIGRIASRIAGVKNVFYTAHGFHFFKGAAIINWLVFYPVEFLLSFLSTKLFVINKEDYTLAKKSFYAKETVFVPGVGINLNKFKGNSLIELRNELGLSTDKTIITTIGEFIERKNYPVVIKSFSCMRNTDSVLIICGVGKLQNQMIELAESLGVKERVYFLGYRKDIVNVLAGSDIFLFPSKQEGLPVSVMEAMASGLPVVCSKIRGNTDLITNRVNGFLCSSENVSQFSEYLDELASDAELRGIMGQKNIQIVKTFSSDAVKEVMYSHYSNL